MPEAELPFADRPDARRRQSMTHRPRREAEVGVRHTCTPIASGVFDQVGACLPAPAGLHPA